MRGATEVLLHLLPDLAVIIALARLFGAAARRVGQPAVIGEIVAGIVLGPTVLGRLVPGLPAKLFPPDVPLRPLADLGLVFFMFLVGLELDGTLVRKEGRRALSISLAGVIVPFAIGAVLAVPLLPLNNGGVFLGATVRPPAALPFCLFMGAAMCITAFPVLARILVERGLYRSPLGTSVLCAAAIDDVTAWVLLAGVVGITRTGTPFAAARTLVLAGIFTAVMLTAGRRVLALLAARQPGIGKGHVTVDQVAAVVVGLLLCAYATEAIGIHAILGAFLFGAIVPRESAMIRSLTDKIEDFAVVVLLPVFFAVAGLRTNVFALDSPLLALWTVLIIAIAITGKMAGCGVAARLSGYSGRDAVVIGSLMNTRGLTELVILSVGLELGVLSDRTYAMMLIMALVTTLMATPIINRIMPRREMIRVLSGGDPAAGALAVRILVALGDPANAPALVDAGLLLTGGRRPAELLLVHLVPTARAPEFRSGLRDEGADVDEALEIMARVTRRAADRGGGVATRTVSFLSDNVGRDLAAVAAVQRCDILLLGWQRRPLEHGARGRLRTIAHRAFKLAPCDVVVLVDRSGDGIVVRDSSPDSVVLALTTPGNEGGDDGVVRVAADVANSLGLGDSVQRLDIGPRWSGTVDNASIAVVGVERLMGEDSDFGERTDGVVRRLECPVLVVRAANAPVAIRPRRSLVADAARAILPSAKHRGAG